MTESETETIGADELAEVPEPIVFDPDVERENAAAASAASAAAGAPRRPAPVRDPDAPVDPRRALVKAMMTQFEADLDTGKYTPVAINMGSLADVAMAMTANLPAIPDYDAEDSPRERFYDHRAPELDPEEYYIPGGARAGAVTTGAVPVPQSTAVRRTTVDGLEVVEIPIRPAGAAEQDPGVVLQLPLRAAQAFGFAVLSATWADPVPVDAPSRS